MEDPVFYVHWPGLATHCVFVPLSVFYGYGNPFLQPSLAISWAWKTQIWQIGRVWQPLAFVWLFLALCFSVPVGCHLGMEVPFSYIYWPGLTTPCISWRPESPSIIAHHMGPLKAQVHMVFYVDIEAIWILHRFDNLWLYNCLHTSWFRPGQCCVTSSNSSDDSDYKQMCKCSRFGS